MSVSSPFDPDEPLRSVLAPGAGGNWNWLELSAWVAAAKTGVLTKTGVTGVAASVMKIWPE